LTSPSSPEPQTFVLEDWTVDPATGEIRRGQQTARLEPRVMEVLLHLVGAGGRVVSKEELFEVVWGDVAVTQDVLRRCIYGLRSALGDDPEQPRYIRTLPRRGYQLVATVSYPAAEDAPAERADSPVRPQPGAPAHDAAPVAVLRTSRRRWAAAAIIVLALGAAWIARVAASGASDASAPRGEVTLADATPSPTTADGYFELAMGFAKQRGGDDMERAIELFNRALELDPDHARAHAELANVYALTVRGYFRDMGRLDLAIEHATLALGLDPDMVEANKALGIAFAGKGWLTSAAREYERALEVRPDYQAVINNLAIIEVDRGHLARALALQRKLDNAAPRRALHLSNLGYTYRLLEDYPQARRVLEASLEVMPDNAQAASNLAIIDLVEGDDAAARARLRDTMPLYPSDAPFLATAGLVELTTGAPDAAEALFNRSAELSAYGTNNRAWLGLAYLHLQRDEIEQARSIFSGFFDFAEESRRLRREHWAPHYNLTAIYAMSGDVGAALDELEQAVEMGFVDAGILGAYPFFRRLQGDPRYEAIVSDLHRRVAKMRNEAYETDAH